MIESSARPGWRRWTIGALVIAVVFMGGWLTAQGFVSPAQRDAAADPPPPGDVTAVVTRGALTQVASAQAEFESEQVTEVALTLPNMPAIVTSTPVEVGAVIHSGDSVLEINGRPIIVYSGTFPFYRNLAMGDSGPDVEQLQRALRAAGQSVEADGLFGSETQRALSAIYKKLGHEVPGSMKVSEALVITHLPATLESAPPIGTSLDSLTQIAFSTGDLIARIEVTEAIASSVSPGTYVGFTLEDGTAAEGEVRSVVRTNEGEERILLEVIPIGDPYPLSWRGMGAVAILTLVEGVSDSLIVPSAAIVTSADGGATVLKRQADGSFITVPVIEIAELSGRSAVVSESGDLVEGDIIRVG